MTTYILIIITGLGHFPLATFTAMQDCVANGQRITERERPNPKTYHAFLRAHCERIELTR